MKCWFECSLSFLFLLSIHISDPSGGRAAVFAVDAGAAEQRWARAALHVCMFDSWVSCSSLTRDPTHPGHSDQPATQPDWELVRQKPQLNGHRGLFSHRDDAPRWWWSFNAPAFPFCSSSNPGGNHTAGCAAVRGQEPGRPHCLLSWSSAEIHGKPGIIHFRTNILNETMTPLIMLPCFTNITNVV